MTYSPNVTPQTTSPKSKFSYINDVPNNYVYAAGAGLTSLALFGFLAYRNKGEPSGTNLGLLSLASLAGVIPAVCCWFNPYNAKSKEAEEFEKVRKEDLVLKKHEVHIDRDSKVIEKELGTMPLAMWDPQVHGEGYAFRWSGVNAGIKVEDRDKFNDVIKKTKSESEEIRQTIESHKNDVVDASLMHYKYKVKVEDHEIDILIPQIYAEHRIDAVENYLKGIENNLSLLPASLLKLVKKIQFHIGDSDFKNSTELATMHAMGDGSIHLHMDSFNFKDPSAVFSQDETNMQNYIINKFLFCKPLNLRVGSGNASGTCLHHEVGHLLQYFIKNNCIGANIPKEIFPEGSELRNKDLTITQTFADSAIPKELIAFPGQTDEAEVKEKVLKWMNENRSNHDETVSTNDENDAWLQVAKADKRHISVGGLKSGEDFPETFAAFFMAALTNKTEEFYKMLPNRSSFLVHSLKWLEDISKPQQSS